MFNPVPVRKCWCNNEESIQEFLCTPWLLRCFSFIGLGEISLSLCLSASLNVCASILTSLFFFCLFFYVCVLSEGLCVPIRLVRNDPKAPSEECYVVWRSPRRYMCFALFCAALGYGVPVFTLTWSVSLVLKPLSTAFTAQH